MSAANRSRGAPVVWPISVGLHILLMGLLALVAMKVRKPGESTQDVIFGSLDAVDILDSRDSRIDQLHDRVLFEEPEAVVSTVGPERVEVTTHMEFPVYTGCMTGDHDPATDDIPRGGTTVRGSVPRAGRQLYPRPRFDYGQRAPTDPANGANMKKHPSLPDMPTYKSRGLREEAVRKYGGQGTIRVVDEGLAWLARNQHPDGHWDSGDNGRDEAVTGLAVLAFLGSGHTETSGRYSLNVKRAIRWIIKQQNTNGAIGKLPRVGYSHPICGLALAEAYGMSQILRTGSASHRALSYSINKHQTPGSGWRYNAREGADHSVTGWFVMQVRSAMNLSRDTSKADTCFDGVRKFLDQITNKMDRPGVCGYQSTAGGSDTMAAVGAFCRQLLGWKNNDPLVVSPIKRMQRWRMRAWYEDKRITVYYLLYGSLVMFQKGGKDWNNWNTMMRKVLMNSQHTFGKHKGSWEPAVATYGRSGGRVYTTAMAVLCLETYYRYTPFVK